MLSSGLSMKVLAGVGALLLLAALGLPFLFSASDLSEPDQNDTNSVWQPQQPAASAPMAPEWGGASHETANWELPAGAQRYAQPDVSSTPAWAEAAQPAETNAYLPQDAASPPQASGEQPWDDRLDPLPWSEQPPEQARVPQHGSVPSDGRRYWELPADQPKTPAWSQQVGVAPGPSPQDQTGWSPEPNTMPQDRTDGSPQTNTSPDDYRMPPTSWSELRRTPSWEVPPYRTSEQADAQRPPAVDRYAPQDRSAYSSGDHASRYPANRLSTYPRELQGARRDEPGEYHAADARGGLPTRNPAEYRSDSGHESTAPATTYPPIGSTPSRSPANRYGPPSSPPSRYSAPPSSPPSRYPAHSRRPINTAERSAPVAGVPAADYEPAVYPMAGRSDGAPSYGVSAIPSYGAGTDTRLAEPGVARFQGGIEKPSGSNPYDRTRPSTY